MRSGVVGDVDEEKEEESCDVLFVFVAQQVGGASRGEVGRRWEWAEVARWSELVSETVGRRWDG